MTSRLALLTFLGVVSIAQLFTADAAAQRPRRRWDPPPPATNSADQQNCTTSAPQVVDDIYQQVLERPADQASAGFSQELASGRATVRDIVARVAKSDEHADRFFWQPLVSAIYRRILHREPSPEELRDTASQLALGQRQLPEVIARTAARATDNQEDAVRILYRRLLGREADEQGLRAFTDLARREGIEAVARDIVASREYRQHTGASGVRPEDAAIYEAAVQSLYRHLLGRDPDPAGLQHLTRVAMASGFDAVIDRMIGSSEYAQLFGSNTVPGRGRARYCGAGH